MEGSAGDRGPARPTSGEVRGAGLMVGHGDGGREAKPIVAKCLEEGLVVNAAGSSVLRFLPPLTVTEDEIDRALSILSGVMAGEASG